MPNCLTRSCWGSLDPVLCRQRQRIVTTNAELPTPYRRLRRATRGSFPVQKAPALAAQFRLSCRDIGVPRKLPVMHWASCNMDSQPESADKGLNRRSRRRNSRRAWVATSCRNLHTSKSRCRHWLAWSRSVDARSSGRSVRSPEGHQLSLCNTLAANAAVAPVSSAQRGEVLEVEASTTPSYPNSTRLLTHRY